MVEKKRNHFERIVEYLNDHREDSGIIYCLSRKNTEELAAQLQEEGFVAAAYHAGLDNEIRKKRQEQFKRDELKIIVATIAFGMGIDKSNVRFILTGFLVIAFNILWKVYMENKTHIRFVDPHTKSNGRDDDF